MKSVDQKVVAGSSEKPNMNRTGILLVTLMLIFYMGESHIIIAKIPFQRSPPLKNGHIPSGIPQKEGHSGILKASAIRNNSLN